MYALVDCNNFYVSCERIFKPNLRHQPIVVLSNNDGCVISRSNEAKKLGIPMAAAAFEYKSKFKELGIHVFSSNYALYGDMSNRVYRILQNSSEYTLKRYDKINSKLVALNPEYTNSVIINEDDEVVILGVVDALVRNIKKRR